MGGPASLVSSACSAEAGITVPSSPCGGGSNPPAVSTVPHSFGSCAMVSGGLPIQGLAPGTGCLAASIADFFQYGVPIGQFLAAAIVAMAAF